MCSFKGISPLILLFAVPLITSTKQLPGDGADDDLIRVVHRPNSSLALTSSSTPSVVVPVPELASQPRSRPTLLGGRKSTSLVGLGGNGMGGAAAAGLVLNEGKGMPKTARFFGIRTTVQSELMIRWRSSFLSYQWLTDWATPRYCLLLRKEWRLAKVSPRDEGSGGADESPDIRTRRRPSANILSEASRSC